jgi:hypothetical protein
MITAEAVRSGLRYRVIDEGDQRERLDRCIVDADLIRWSEMLQNQHVAIREQGIEAADHQDRQRREQPCLEVIGLGPGRNTAGKSAVDEEELDKDRQPD